MKIFTSRVGYKGKPGELVLDTTAKSATGLGTHFAPEWEMVNALKDNDITWEEYATWYRAHLRWRYYEDHKPFRKVLEFDVVVLLCYCATDEYCHRRLLAEVLVKVAQSQKIEVEYAGEKTTPVREPKIKRLI